jgi:hypothetical protein
MNYDATQEKVGTHERTMGADGSCIIERCPGFRTHD